MKANKAILSGEDFWLVQFFVLFRIAKRPVSENAILADFHQRKIVGSVAVPIRKTLQSFVKKGYLREISGEEPMFVATHLGKQVASEASARLSVFLHSIENEH